MDKRRCLWAETWMDTWTKDGAMENTCKMRGQGNGINLGTREVNQKKFGVIRTTPIL